MLLTAWGAFTCVLPAAAIGAPNIIFVLCDDLGVGDVGVFFQNARQAANDRSEPWHLTPKIDALAAEGMRLTQHYCPASVCAPSRASLLLGVHQGHANVRDNQFDKALENNHTLGTVLKQAGYATAAIGKWGLQGGGANPAAWPAYPTKRGFDYYYGYVRHGDGHEHYPKEGVYRGSKEVWEMNAEVSANLDGCYTADLWTARAKQWIIDQRSTNSSQPFFLYLAFDTPHAVDELPAMAYPTGGGTNGGLQWLGAPGGMINTATNTVDSYYHPDYANATWDADNNPVTPEVAWPDVYKRYATSVRRIDDCMGDLRQLLRDLNIATNTLVVFSSDNGPSIESYLPQNLAANFFNSFGPFDGIKRDLWEGGVRMPTIAWWPGLIASNSVCTLPSQFHDWLPTFAEMAGATAPARSDGVSLLPALTGTGVQRTPTVYSEYYHNGTTPGYAEFVPAHRSRQRSQMQLLRLGNLLGVRYNIGAATNDFEIYDVVNDPQESTNLAPQAAYAALQQQMKDRVLQLRRPDASAPRPYDWAHIPASTNAGFTNGVVAWAAFEGAWPWVPEFAALTPVSTGTVAGVDLSVRPRDTDFGIAFSGFINLPADGDYTFYVNSDSGAHLRIHEATVIDDDFGRTGAESAGTIRLKAGRHPFRLYYRHGTGDRRLSFAYSGPCLPKQPVPPMALSLAGNADPRPQAFNDCTRTAQSTAVLIPVLANDTDDGAPAPLRVFSVGSPQAGTAVTNTAGQVLYTPAAGFLGEDTFGYTVSDGDNTSSATVSVAVYFATNSIWFPFNQASGLETEEAGGGIVATLSGFASETEPWVEGRWNRAVQFDGVSRFATIEGGYLPPSGTNARTTAAWIKTSSTGSIIAWGANSTSRKWMMRLESATNFTGALRLEVGGGYVVGTKDLRDNQWHHLAAVLPPSATPNATNVLLYVDGVPEPPGASSASSINTDSVAVTIGTDAQNRFLDGAIDEVRIYNRALTAGEIFGLFSSTNQSAAVWLRRYFGVETGSWLADDDGDRGQRLLEYALGAEPHVADPKAQSLAAELIADRLQVRFQRRVTGTHELNYALLTSSNLFQWSPSGMSELGTEPSGRDGFEEVVFRSDLTIWQTSPLHVRLAVGLP